MRMRLSRLHYPVTTLGPGRRAGIWFQGCTIRCASCMSVDTWPKRPDRAVEVSSVLHWLAGLPSGEVDGVTISGGEPTEQPKALAELLAGIGRWRVGLERACRPDVLVFTGRDPQWMDNPAAAVLGGADAVVVGPYLEAEAGTTPLRGSENQRLVTLTELGALRYDPEHLPPRGGLQGTVTQDGLWLIGIPLPGQLESFEDGLGRHGVELGRPSWRR